MKKVSRMNAWLFSMVLVGVFAACGVVAEELQPVGTMRAVEGSVGAVDLQGSERPMVAGEALFVGDRVVTGPGAKATVKLADGTAVTLGPNSEFVLDEYVYAPGRPKDNVCEIGFTKGSLRVVTDRITRLNPDRFSVKTGLATIGIRGSDLGFRFVDGRLQVIVFDLHGNQEVVLMIGDRQVDGPGSGGFVFVGEDGSTEMGDVSDDMIRQFLGETMPAAGSPVEVVGEDGSTAFMTQGQLAAMLVRVLGVSNVLPQNPSELQCINLLMEYGFVPADGWDPGAYVTLEDLSRLLVQIMGQVDQVQNPDDPYSWIELLETLGVNLDTVSTAMEDQGRLDNPTATIDREQLFGMILDLDYRPVEREPVTPD